MKRVISVLLVIGLTGLLVACGEGGKNKNGDRVVSSISTTTTISPTTQTTTSSEAAASEPASTAPQAAVSSKPAVREQPAVSSKPAAPQPVENTSKPAVASTKPPETSSTPEPAASLPPEPENLAQKQIIGKWKTTTDFSSAYEAVGIPIEGDLTVDLMMEFTADQRLITSVDEVRLRDILRQVMRQALQQQIDQGLLTEEDLCVSIDEYVEMTLDEVMQETMMLAPWNYDMRYSFKGEDLYVSTYLDWFEQDAYVTEQMPYYFLDADTLVLSGEEAGLGSTVYYRMK